MKPSSVFQTVSVIGLGYVGLPTAATIATRGVNVIGVDVNEAAVKTINSGGSHIVETDLDVVLQAAIVSGRLKAVTKPEPADAFVIAVPTPITADKCSDLRAVEAAFRSIAPVLAKGNLVILESTSPVGTTERMAKLLAELRPDLSFPHASPEEADVLVSYCPERILPGQTLRELVDNSRTIGGLDAASAEKTLEFYRIFCRGELFLTSSRAAELVKLSENAFRDVNIAFANELSMLCADLEIDVHEVITAANRHPRVTILQPGPGVGGHCIPVDPWFIVEAQPGIARLIKVAREVNDSKTHFVIDQIKARAERFKRPTIAAFGLAYKPDVDDLRESPAVEIVERLAHDRVGDILVVEPNIDELPLALAKFPNVRLVTLKEAIAKSDILAVLVGHSAFKKVSPTTITEKVVIDTIGLWRKA
jgi:UDP-N-acetyl-D-mannosaminuronic acid dehydrogenase